MTALSLDSDIAPTGGQFRRLPSEISANPYAGSLLSFALDGFVRELVAGEPFAGVARTPIETKDAATADAPGTSRPPPAPSRSPAPSRALRKTTLPTAAKSTPRTMGP